FSECYLLSGVVVNRDDVGLVITELGSRPVARGFRASAIGVIRVATIDVRACNPCETSEGIIAIAAFSIIDQTPICIITSGAGRGLLIGVARVRRWRPERLRTITDLGPIVGSIIGDVMADLGLALVALDHAVGDRS